MLLPLLSKISVLRSHYGCRLWTASVCAVVGIVSNFQLWLTYVTTDDSIWEVGGAAIGGSLLCGLTAGLVFLGFSAISRTVGRVLGFVFIWLVGVPSEVGWVGVFRRFFLPWLADIHEWLSLDAVLGVVGWLLWLYVLVCIVMVVYGSLMERRDLVTGVQDSFDELHGTGMIRFPQFYWSKPAQKNIHDPAAPFSQGGGGVEGVPKYSKKRTDTSFWLPSVGKGWSPGITH